jgi:hypothetical protein
MPLFRKKPVVIEAALVEAGKVPEFLKQAIADGHIYPTGQSSYIIRTLEGTMVALEGDYIIKGVQGEFYPCKPNIFRMTYEPVVGHVELNVVGDRLRVG